MAAKQRQRVSELKASIEQTSWEVLRDLEWPQLSTPHNHRGKSHTHTQKVHKKKIKMCGQPRRKKHIQTHKDLNASWTRTKSKSSLLEGQIFLCTLVHTPTHIHTHTHIHMHLPGQGAWVAVGTRELRENAKLDREIHDSMPLREFTQPNISPTPSLSVWLSLSLTLWAFSMSLALSLSPWQPS